MAALYVLALATFTLGNASSIRSSTTDTVRALARADSACHGQTIRALDIVPQRPPFEGSASRWRTVARALGLHHATTRADVVRAYLLLHEGDACVERRRAESERVLRSLPFLANASVTAEPLDSNDVRLVVRTTDEIPVLVSGRVHGAAPEAFGLGNQNVDGLGVRVVAGAERGTPYRAGAHLQVADYAPLDLPATLGADLARDPLGSHIEIGGSHLFRSDLQRGAWQGSFRGADEFPILIRPDGPSDILHETVEVHEEQWSASGVLRSELDGLVLLFGGVVMGNRVSPTGQSFFDTDSGLVATGDSSLRARFTSFHSTRVGGLFGVRRVRYRTMTGLDALFASQDVMTGVQLGGFAAPGVTAGDDPRAGHDVFFGTSAYAGVAPGRMFAGADAEAEIRRDFTTGDWDSMVGDVRGTAYYQLASNQMLRVNDQFSMLSHARLPAQLTFDDPLGGLDGYAGTGFAGARRNVAHAEYRWARPSAVHHADVGAALFVEQGTLWAGDAPFGQSAGRASIGMSLLASYPSHAKGLYRLDLAIPLQRGVGRGFEVRFTAGDPTGWLFAEPSDVTLARLGPVPSTVFAWPGR